MKAVRLVEVHQPLQMQDIPIPTLGSHDILVRVRAAGICHSDVHYRAGKSPVYPLPMTLGHEVAGVVEAVGTRCYQRSARRPGLPALHGHLRELLLLLHRERTVLLSAAR